MLDKSHAWTDWLHLAEFGFDTNYHTSTNLTSFKALYGYSPPRLMDYVLGIAQVEAMDSFLCSRHELIPLLKQNLISAQARMKLLADQHRFDKSFSVGDWVYLKLQPYRQLSLWVKGYNKLSSRF